MADGANRFGGWPKEAFTFFEQLDGNNTRAWFLENKHTYESCIRAPLERLLASAESEFGHSHVFRPNRDTRFSKDKSPYKTNIGAVIERNGCVFYVHLDHEGLMAATGYYMMASDQIARYRIAVADDTSGAELDAILRELSAKKLDLGEPALKRVPTPFEKDHPRGALLKYKSVTVHRSFGLPAWVSTPRAADRVFDIWRLAAPLNSWLQANVGPSANPEGGWR